MKTGRDNTQCAFDSEAYTQCWREARAMSDRLANPTFTYSGVNIIREATGTTLWVQMDLDADAAIDTSAPSEESIRYAYNAATTDHRQQGTGSANPLADGIQSLVACEGPKRARLAYVERGPRLSREANGSRLHSTVTIDPVA